MRRGTRSARLRETMAQIAEVLAITQGGVLGMSLYGIATLPLAWSMCNAVPGALQPWFANDSSAVDTAEQSA